MHDEVTRVLYLFFLPFFLTFVLYMIELRNLRTCKISSQIFDDTIFQYVECYGVKYEH